jgi:hypothetical protein
VSALFILIGFNFVQHGRLADCVSVGVPTKRLCPKGSWRIALMTGVGEIGAGCLAISSIVERPEVGLVQF